MPEWLAIAVEARASSSNGSYFPPQAANLQTGSESIWFPSAKLDHDRAMITAPRFVRCELHHVYSREPILAIESL